MGTNVSKERGLHFYCNNNKILNERHFLFASLVTCISLFYFSPLTSYMFFRFFGKFLARLNQNFEALCAVIFVPYENSFDTKQDFTI